MKDKSKSLIKLGIVALLIVVVAFLALHGLQVGKYILKPVSRAMGLGLDLGGGVAAEYAVSDTTAENYDSLLKETVSALRARLKGAGLTGATVAVQGTDRILVELPDASGAEETAAAIGATGHLEVRDPDGNVVFEGKDVVSATTVYTDSDRTQAGVNFELNSTAAQAFEDATREYVGQSISLYLDDELISAPTVSEVITGGSVVIPSTGSSTTEESVEWANNLAMVVGFEELPLKLELVETREITAALGIGAGGGAALAGAIALILTLALTAFAYRLPGVAADMALLIDALIAFYAMAVIGVKLTLPGIVGILTGGVMAVSMHAVILERFREALKDGRTPLNAVKLGYRGAGRALTDLNVALLIAAAALLIFGAGAVKSFAETLLICALASLFTALTVTRGLLNLICRLDMRSRGAYTR